MPSDEHSAVAHGNPYQEVKVHLIIWDIAPLVLDVAPPGHSCGTPHTVSTMAPVKLAPLDNMDRLLMMTLPVATIAAPVATVPTRPQSRVRRVSIKLRPPVTPVTGWSRMRVVRALLLHMPFKATAQSVKPVHQGHTPTPVLAPPAPRVVLVLRVATVPTRPRPRVLRAPIKSQPPVTPVTGWSKVRVSRVLLLHLLFKATAQSVKPVRQDRTRMRALKQGEPLVRPVERVASVIMPPLRVPMAPIK